MLKGSLDQVSVIPPKEGRIQEVKNQFLDQLVSELFQGYNYELLVKWMKGLCAVNWKHLLFTSKINAKPQLFR